MGGDRLVATETERAQRFDCAERVLRLGLVEEIVSALGRLRRSRSAAAGDAATDTGWRGDGRGG